jgi:hypothetical protein
MRSLRSSVELSHAPFRAASSVYFRLVTCTNVLKWAHSPFSLGASEQFVSLLSFLLSLSCAFRSFLFLSAPDMEYGFTISRRSKVCAFQFSLKYTSRVGKDGLLNKKHLCRLRTIHHYKAYQLSSRTQRVSAMAPAYLLMSHVFPCH